MPVRWFQFIAWFSLLILPLAGSAQVFYDVEFRTQAAKGLDFTYDAAFDEAHEIFANLRADYPTHPAPLFLMATNRWWQSYISTTTYYHDFIDSTVVLCLELNDMYLEDSPHQLEYTFFGYMGHALHARLATLRQEWLAAANRGRKALPYLDDCLAYTAESPEFFFAAGIYHYYAETYPKDHFYVRPFMVFFPNGNANLGVRELEQAIAEPNFTRIEAMYYLSYIYLEPSARDEAKALAISAQMHQEHAANPWFACEYARVRVHLGKHAQALPTLDSLALAYQQEADGESVVRNSLSTKLTTKLQVRVQHYRGLCFLHGERNYQAGVEAFEASLTLAQLSEVLAGSDYIAANHYYLGCCYQGLGQLEQAREHFQRVLKLDGNERYEKNARRALAELK